MPIIQASAAPQFVRTQLALYGPPKQGKTRTATSLPWGKHWGERAIYCAWDPGSELLESVLPHNREHLVLVYPERRFSKSGMDVTDYLEEAVAMADRDWSKEFPDAKTIIWDTMTETSRVLLEAYSNSGQFSDKHVTFGKPGSATYHSAPMEGDYAAAQRSALFIVDKLFRQPLNLIVLFHDGIYTPKKDADPRAGGMFGGPALVGQAGIQPIASRFNNLFRQDMAPNREGGTIKPIYRLRTQASGNEIWRMGVRMPLAENPVSTVHLDPNPINFWHQLDKALEASRGT